MITSSPTEQGRTGKEKLPFKPTCQLTVREAPKDSEDTRTEVFEDDDSTLTAMYPAYFGDLSQTVSEPAD